VGTNDVVYDPTEMQIRELDKMLDTQQLSVTNLAKNPQAIQLVLRQQALLLYELRQNKTTLLDAKVTADKLRDERESLRISLAQLTEHEKVSVIEIPISIASGFAINILTTKPTDLVGWLLLVITFILLLFLRQRQILPFFSGLKRSKEDK